MATGNNLLSEVVSVDLYQILQCEENCSAETLKKNYQKLALLRHPDKQGNDDEDDFVILNKAWRILGDPDLRSEYDMKRKQRLLQQESPMHDTVDFSEFKQAYCEVSSLSYFLLDCRCGGEYFLHEDQVQIKDSIVQCNTCSLHVEVIYDT